MNLLKIESRFQEVVYFMTLVLVPATLFAASSFLWMGDQSFLMIFGNLGTQLLHQMFQIFGYAFFSFSISAFLLGQIIIRRCKSLSDLKSSLSSVAGHSVFLLGMTVVLASYASIFEQYFQFSVNERMLEGAGGIAGYLVGANLFHYFGLFGSLLSLTAFALLMGIASGHFQLVNSILSLENHFLTLWSRLEKVVARWLYSREREDAELEKRRIEEEHRRAFEDYSMAAMDIRQAVNSSTVEIPLNLISARPSALNQMPSLVEEEKDNEIVKPRKRRMKIVKNEVDEQEVMSEEIAMQDESSENESSTSDEVNGESVKIKIPSYKKKYAFPEASLLDKAGAKKSVSEKVLEQKGKDLEERLLSFGIKGKVTEIHPGSRLTMFEYLPDSGMKLSKIQALSTDLALLLGAPSIRILAPIPGKTTVGIEVPNSESRMVKFAELIPDLEKKAKSMELPIALGLNVNNEVIISDMASMPHLLVSGTTGSGKSVFINTLINSLIFTRSPKDLRFIMVDPKMIELTPYNGIPHLLQPVISDVTYAKDVLKWAEAEMDLRYQMLSELGARNISSFNEKISKSSKATIERKLGRKITWNFEPMPYLVIVVDELADLMITQGKEVEIPITRIAQKARACGIHMVISTQRPSAEIVTGLIKTNFPTRIAFKVSSAIDSRTILDVPGAEKLLGHGDMLFMPNGKALERLQGAFLGESEVTRVVEKISE